MLRKTHFNEITMRPYNLKRALSTFCKFQLTDLMLYTTTFVSLHLLTSKHSNKTTEIAFTLLLYRVLEKW